MQLPNTIWKDWEKSFLKYRLQIFFLFIGIALLGLGIFFFQNQQNFKSSKVEILEEGNSTGDITIEVAGAVINPGVYQLASGARVEDALIAAKGFSADANRVWVEKMVNRAAVLKDGQKIYIPREDEQSSSVSAGNYEGVLGENETFQGPVEGSININTASQSQLESLVGIGPVYAQNIIAHRHYSTLEELVSKGAIGKSVFEKIKNQITVY
jgi:competence protein ComEA